MNTDAVERVARDGQDHRAVSRSGASSTLPRCLFMMCSAVSCMLKLVGAIDPDQPAPFIRG